MQGTGAIAGEESSGTMDLLLAQPVTRRDAVLQKATAGVLSLIAIIAIGYLGWLISIPFVDIEVSLWDVFLGNVNLLPISLLFFALSLYAGAVLPTRSAAVGLVVGLAVAAYFAQTVAAIVDGLSWIEYLTPFYYYGAGAPLVDGMNWWHIALLLGPRRVVGDDAADVRPPRRECGGATDLGLSGVMRRIAAVRSGV